MAAQRGPRGDEAVQASSMMTQAVRRPAKRKTGSKAPAGAGETHRAQRDSSAAVRLRGSDAVLATPPTAAGATVPKAAKPPAVAQKRSAAVAAAAAPARPRRSAAVASAKPAATAATQPAGMQAHHDHAHVPPADHHAERKTAAADAAAPAAEPRQLRSRKRGRAASGAADSSDSDASPPRRPRSARLSGTAADAPVAVKAETSLFSPTFSLSGGVSAADLPEGSDRESTPSPSPRGTVKAPATPPRPIVRQQSLGALPAPDRPPVCSPPRPVARSKLAELEPSSEDDGGANSENDTQMRLSGPGAAVVDQQASASDADSSQANLPEALALMCAGEAVVPESSDEEEAHAVARPVLERQPAGALQPLQPSATVPAEGQVEEDYDDEYMEFDPYLFIRKLPPLSSVVTGARSVLLPRQTRASKRKTLVLDLDETLVHSSLDSEVAPHFTFPVTFGGRVHQVAVCRRPHLAAFLERVASLFEIVIFTASQKIYAEQLLNVLDPERRLIRHRIFRDSCVYVEGNYLKDLSILGRDLAATIIIDNSPQAFGYQLANGIPIESWYDDEADQELMAVLPFLESLVDAPDVRPHILGTFKLAERVAQAPSPEPRQLACY